MGIAETWRVLGTVAPRRLAAARGELHRAAQLVAAPGRGLLPPRQDDLQTSLEWIDAPRLLAGAPVGEPGLRAALRLSPPELVVTDAGGGSAQGLPLAGRTLAEGRDWLGARVRAGGLDERRLAFEGPYALAPHALDSGATFAAGGPAHEELERWLGNAHAVLRELCARYPGATPIRCWPHHFDLGAVLALEPGDSTEKSPSIGVGLSPGDEDVDQPYFYVTPWPPPGARALPELPAGGRWHREGWVGALLTGQQLVAAGPASAQAERALAFLASADLLRDWLLGGV